MIDSYALQLGRLLNAQASRWSELCGRTKPDANGTVLRVNLHALKFSGIECQPESLGSHINTRSERIERRDLNCIACDFDVAAECEPAEFGMMDDVGGGVENRSRWDARDIPQAQEWH